MDRLFGGLFVKRLGCEQYDLGRDFNFFFFFFFFSFPLIKS
jgi:hypothetical protein